MSERISVPQDAIDIATHRLARRLLGVFFDSLRLPRLVLVSRRPLGSPLLKQLNRDIGPPTIGVPRPGTAGSKPMHSGPEINLRLTAQTQADEAATVAPGGLT